MLWSGRKEAWQHENLRFLGWHRAGRQTVFRYEVDGVPILDRAEAIDGNFVRTLQNLGTESRKIGEVDLAPDATKEIVLYAQPQWPETLRGSQTQGAEDGPLAIDRLYVPTDNPARSMMLLSGIDFAPNGDAIVCTLHGEVWRVSGLGGDGDIGWRKIAGGINQPFGLRCQGELIYIMARTQVLALHDRNGDQEIDFYEVIADDFDQRDRGIAMHFGLELASDGSLWFITSSQLRRWSPETRKTTVISEGFRNGMGLARFGDRILVAPQEGDWTPASMIVDAQLDAHYGFGGFGKTTDGSRAFDSPLCFVPRGIDNSTGGMLAIDRDSWGPLKGALYCISYGAGTHYYVLQDGDQGAVVPLRGEFESGVVRAAFGPDDHIYVVGTEGWGNYAIADGSLNRVRYTGKPLRQPVGFSLRPGGIRVDFDEQLGAVDKVLVQQWNYEYASRYGSPEFSINQPDQLGHDVLPVESIDLLDNGSSIFVAIPDLQPAMQVYLRMHLQTAGGERFKADLFPTITQLGDQRLTLRKRIGSKKPKKKPKTKADRSITLTCVTGLRYDRIEIPAKAGEKLGITLKNADAMPHNWVLVKPDAYKAVGEASFKMLSDPAAAEKNYVPDLPSVIADIPLVQPGKSLKRVIQVPKKPGRYPFLCTFPGHWQAMKGVLIVER